MKIIHTERADLDFIYYLFEAAIAYQKKNNYPAWRTYDKSVLSNEVDNHLQYKILEDGEIALIFSIGYADKIIWRERDKGDALYLHRMAINPVFKGRQMFANVLEWTKKHCKEKDIRYVRMDTWADNPVLIDYYKSFGFGIYEYFHTPDVKEIPEQQRNNDIVLLELDLYNDTI